MSAAFEEMDEILLHRLRRLWGAVDPVPAGLGDAVKYAMTVRMLEAEVAELTQVDDVTAVRSEPAEKVRSLSFSGSRLSLMISITESGGTWRLDGWVTGGGALVELHRGAQVTVAVADQYGRLVFTEVPPGPAHFILWVDESRSGRPTITPTFEL